MRKDVQYRARARLIKRAQDMARSGHHANADSIAATLEADSEFYLVRGWFADARLRGQLERLCAAARDTRNADRRER
jgi:hypothetical protein